MQFRRLIVLSVLAHLTGLFTTCFAGDEVYKLVIKDHQFSPVELSIPSGKKIKLFVENQDSTTEEFESYDLNREKIVPGNGKITLFLGPLRQGIYKYFGEFHKKSAKGIIKVTN
ncbi:MAG: hypothetical protein AUJ72_03910 [Candidatus Omnitrophica bacterium CG1_02_46_14]|nr:MAG: hypothetical protein AUJ72_03910 [Candidatus Omnitrophica bacterium CG1_02_46_14]